MEALSSHLHGRERAVLIDFFAPCPLGVEDLLAHELRESGAVAVKVTRAGAHFQGDVETALRACLWSRIASRVLMPLSVFEAPDSEALYAGAAAVPWELHIDTSRTLAVRANVSASRLNHSGYAALKVKDAVVDRQRRVCGGRSIVQPTRPDVRIDLHIHQDVATLSLDLSGEALSNRGYRIRGGEAPLRENLAAAVLLRAGWPQLSREGAALLDPMCGTGTLLIEGVAMAADIAPGLARRHFGFLGWKQFPREAWSRLLAEAGERAGVGRNGIPGVYGFDADPIAVEAAATNVAAADLEGLVRLGVRSVAELSPPSGERGGLVVVNPPYGHRLGTRVDVMELYVTLAFHLRQSFSGWNAAILVEREELGRQLGLRAHKVHRLYNGSLPCRLLHFHLGGERWRPWESSGADGAGLGTIAAETQESEATAAPKTGRSGVAWSESRSGRELANRFRKNLRHLGRWARREGISCYRLYDRDLPDFNFALDLYEDWALIQEYAAPDNVEKATVRRRRNIVFAVAAEVLGLDPGQIFFRLRERQRGTDQYQRHAAHGAVKEVGEGGLRFLVNPTDYLDTGLFLHHRITRGLIREWAEGLAFLSLFSYTGAATVYAAAGGAASTTSVDMSRTYLRWAKDNLALNGFQATLEPGDVRRGRAHAVWSPRGHQLIQADCVQWLADAGASTGPRYDLVFADVPTFSNSKRMRETFDAERDHVALLRGIASVLEPGGRVVFSTNRRRFRLDEAAIADQTGLVARDLTARTIPPDFSRRPHVHRCWLFSRTMGPAPATVVRTRGLSRTDDGSMRTQT